MRIAVPMMGKEAETLMRQARAIAAYPGVDMAEWRADALERALTPDAVCAILPALLRALADKPMIFTLRTEGGAARADYAALLLTAARCGAPWIDVEALRCPDAAGLIASLHAQGCRVIASHHDFDGTPALPALLDQARALRPERWKVSTLRAFPLATSTTHTFRRLSMKASFRLSGDQVGS